MVFVRLKELEDAGRSAEWPADLAVLSRWLRDFICQPDPRLNRPGAVCPCAVLALDAGRVLLDHLSLDGLEPTDKRDSAVARLLSNASEFKRTTSDEEFSLDCLLVTVTGVAGHELRYVLDGAYHEVKPRILEQKLMVGGFHPLNDRWSATNPDFFPMRPSVPVFAMRHMNRTDWRSLRESELFLSIYAGFYGWGPITA